MQVLKREIISIKINDNWTTFLRVAAENKV